MDPEEIIYSKNQFEFTVEAYGGYLRHDDTESLAGDAVDLVLYPHVLHYSLDHSLTTYWVRAELKETIYRRCYDFHKLSLSTGILSELLSATNPTITPGTDLHDKIVNDIFRKVNGYSNPGSMKLLTVIVVIIEKVLEHCECQCDECIARCQCEECSAIRESILMAEMEAEKLLVPASESSIKKILKRVRVVAADPEEEGDHEGRRRKRMRGPRPSDIDDCRICFDEFTAGNYAIQMPCFHSFHGPCIRKWLRRSHFCPICRYEMPV